MNNLLHSENGVDFLSNGMVPHMIQSGSDHFGRWIGVMHATPDREIEQHLQHDETCLRNMSRCLGVYSLSRYVRDWLNSLIDVPVEILRLPVRTPTKLYEPDMMPRRVVTIGHWMRRLDSIAKLRLRRVKPYVLECGVSQPPQGTGIIPRLSSTSYDEMLATSLVFLDLVDSSANNTVIECIVRNTPLIVNRTAGVVEHLGTDYPLFYDSLEEASELLEDEEAILTGWRYLHAMDKSMYNVDFFIDTMCQGPIYSSLPRLKF